MLFEWSSLLTFSLAALVLIVIPGPAVLYIVARSLDQGKIAGIVSVLGVNVGAGVHILAAALGISTILATSAMAFTIVEYLGAGYLIYLGISTLRKKTVTEKVVMEEKSLRQIFGQGIVVNAFNPKAALFFLAFLPQFTDPTRGAVTLQIVILGLIFILIAFLSDSFYALLAGEMGHWFKQNPTWQRKQQYISGTMYIALGITAAMSGGQK